MKLNIFPIHATPSHYGNRCCRRLTHARAYTQNQMNIFRSVTTNDIMVVFAASAIHRNWRKVLRARINPRQFRMKQCIENFLSIQIWYWLICEWFEYGCRPFFDDSYASRESNICTRGVYRYTIECVFVWWAPSTELATHYNLAQVLLLLFFLHCLFMFILASVV